MSGLCRRPNHAQSTPAIRFDPADKVTERLRARRNVHSLIFAESIAEAEVAPKKSAATEVRP